MIFYFWKKKIFNYSTLFDGTGNFNFFTKFVKLDPDPHWESSCNRISIKKNPDPQKMNADTQRWGSNGCELYRPR